MDTPIKVRINWVCKTAKKNVPYEAENIYFDAEMTFIPPIGSHLQVHKDGELGKVGDIYIDLYRKNDDTPPPIFIYFEEPDNDVDLRPWPEMKKQGWTLEGGAQ